MHLTPCDTCPAPCCRNYSVDVSVFDAYRIAATLHMSMAEFTELVWSEEADEVRRILFADNGRFYRLRLQKVADGEGERCIFLHAMPSRSMCSIYAFRPELCRTYPTYFEYGVLATSGGKYCPENAWSIERFNVRQLRADWTLRHRTRALHDAMIDGWNERVLAEPDANWVHGDFYGYVTTTLREVEALVPALFERPALGAAVPDPFPKERCEAIIDGVLRQLGWRTAATVAHARPEIGRKLKKLPVIPADFDVTAVELPAG